MLNLLTLRVIIAFAVLLGLIAMLRHIATKQPLVETDAEGETGRIAPNRALLTVICLIGAALAGAALLAFSQGTGGWAVLAVAVAALAMTGMMVTAFFSYYDITWDEDGIEGPTLLLPPPLGPKRQRIFWEEIEIARHDKGRHWYLEDGNGARIVWSFIYFGCPALIRRVEEECPWLFKAQDSAPLPENDPEAIPPVKRRFLRLNFATAKST